MTNAILDYLGKPASSLLTSPPFESWKFKRTVDNDLPEIRIDYVSARNKFSFICDVDEKIDSIFIEADNLDRSLLDISFSLSRNDVLRILGVPSKSGAARRDPFLGEYGPWDRFDEAHHSIHISYHAHANRITRVTLMRANAVP
ncbi:MAG: hypothetical protein EOS25_18180 [Mesorhizobium sp.]|uniref:hypothetical protein n=1 Tax=Mesorhizobium sp. TaxID=1871066 RepID=UPI000FE9CD1B|nr:hypothetical protein [Mesorhizobium sp.]RWD44404.1 MAG: hypothetical protein EOS59_23410 [Mesorhizobium sp.]RWE53902.1 MAG: hypothetical protein EOS24_26325 [Mesorhizobium sp.]RWF11847.1 MAG: hypothetical protein EOS69_07440 [Mesorhizobium sp.]RWF17068.1 MAG: hypothetical protein EOS25_18180 [Mesorhizobium sp.]TIW48144.1 MAG: hypothetical protein E5V71_02685 [Mesorhizobium sp.]